MAKSTKEKEVMEEKVISPEQMASAFFKENKEDHLNFHEQVKGVVSSGSIKMDIELGGGYGPGVQRLVGHNNSGKALVNWAKVLTPTGWVKIADLKVGDEVIGSDGLPHKVLGVYPQGKKEYFKLTLNDGSFTHPTEDHLWFTETLLDRAAKRKGSVKTTLEINNSLIKNEKCNHSIPTVKPIQFEEKELLVHPYILGVLLSDGSFGDSIELSNSQPDIIDKISKLLPETLSLSEKSGSPNGKRFSIVSTDGQHFFKYDIEKLGLLGKDSFTKFIPNDYLFASVKQRLSLLQGLLDTDAYIPKECPTTIEHSTASPILHEGIVHLARSLGARVTTSVKEEPKFVYKGETKIGAPAYIARISLDNNLIPVSSVKRLNLYNPNKTRHARCIKSIEKAGYDDCTCIKVDSEDSLFVTDDFILTHNTPMTLEGMRNFIETIPSPRRGIYVNAEGKLSELNKKRSGLKFVTRPEEWVDGSVLLVNTNKYEFVIGFLRKIIKENPTKCRYGIVLDSTDALVLKTDDAKDISENVKVAGSPLLSKRFLSSMNLELTHHGHYCWMIGQVTADVKIDPYAKTEPKDGNFSGGNALAHFPVNIIEVNKFYQSDLILDPPTGKINDGKTKILGHWCKTIIRKSENEKNFVSVLYPIKHGRTTGSAVWVEYEIVDLLLEWGLATKGGAWIQFSEDLIKEVKENGLEIVEKIQGLDNARNYLEENPKLTDYLAKKFKALLAAKI